MKKLLKNLPVAMVVLLLIACAIGYYSTRETAAPRVTAKRAGPEPELVDDSLLQTARRLAGLTDSEPEQDQAREALRLSDHELDLAFATAIREAATPDVKKGVANKEVQQLEVRVAQLKTKLAARQDRVAQLSKQSATDPAAADQLELVKAQLELDQDDLDDAQQDLARAGGDAHDRLTRAQQRHEALEQVPAVFGKIASSSEPGTLKDQAGEWSSLNAKRTALVDAMNQASAKAAELERRHNSLESQANAATQPDDSAGLNQLHQLSSQKKTLTDLDKRIQDCRLLSTAYQTWAGLVDARQRAALHLVLRSLLAIFAIVLVLLFAHRLTLYAVRTYDRRKRHLVKVASEIACELVGVIVILLILFGPPNQLSTMLGLATAGLTVVFKDFIVGFIGWFVLMGRNGVRIGDWVEINGVGGEVIEIGVLKTVLLEMGNWTNNGHPTGRRVSFSNSYAIEGHYFNFSTVGQWLWDELQVTLPASGDPYQTAELIRQTVERETEAASAEAEQDWERVTHQYGVTAFSAKPAVDLRPGANGLDVSVRYITRAPQRYEVKSRLFQAIVALLHAPASHA